MKVLFIYPNAGSQLGFNYGVSHMSALLKQAGHEVECWQLCEDLGPLPTRGEFVARLKGSAPGVVGFSVVTNQWPYARELAKWAREATDAPLVCGGIHATVACDEVLESKLFDYVLVGECDEAFADFVDRVAKNQNALSLPNVAYVGPDGPKLNPVRPLPILRDLPPKDYDIFDFQQMIDAKNGWVGVMASRGCPYSCSYCFNHHMVSRYRDDLGCSFKELNYIRHHDVEQVIDEIRMLLAKYRNISMFIFDDDLFTYDKDFVMRFAEAYPKVSKVPFVINAHVGVFDDDRAGALAGAGCRIVKIGIESGSPRIRDKVLNRHMTNDAIKETLGFVHRHGMHSSTFIMIGLPGETREDVDQTVGILAESQPGRFRWTYFFPYPGTKSYEMAKEYINFAKMDSLTNFTDEFCLDFGAEQNLYLKKLGRIMPWFVNARSDLKGAPIYAKRVDELLAMDEAQWDKVADTLRDEDRKLSAECQEKGLDHYAIMYNRFMGVRSDYFLNEK